MDSFITKDQKADGKDHDTLVLKRNEADRVFWSVTSLQEDTGGGMLPLGK